MNISDLLNTINSTAKFKVDKKKGISIKELHEIEKTLGIKLPDDLVEFYTFSNGLEGDDLIFNIIPINEVEKDNDNVGEYLFFAEYLIYSETCGLEIDLYDKNKYKFFYLTYEQEDYNKPQRNYIGDSIIDFITLYSKEGTFGIFRG
ncbi:MULTISPECIES: SMI1/KNR4 family protein [unclassified Arcicella]|uniref:SMI1/KNR4 family protein n=1 Tax=unclassified Arcicella TaxID=2644986 RepID=UPI0028583D32|nr:MULTISPECIES: SMI1/KNR4 family protein [unclassified Arcicella]MDR6564241.1 hypothetical protein [Arcicella sp. BE51]MDR6811512.1 hypothetical protein [Arcicella sp. BE140]MDR6823038.1 hypothetical protein [Arcicella sp. BE139]